MILFVALFSLFVGINLPYQHIDVDLSPFMTKFDNTIEAKCNKFQYYKPNKRLIVFKDLTYPLIGLCTNTILFYKIEISSSWWKYANPDDRKQLIYHEGTHCAFWEGHSSNPFNYMYAYQVSLSDEEIDRQFDEMIRKHCP